MVIPSVDLGQVAAAWNRYRVIGHVIVMTRSQPYTTVVLGIGNVLLTDDGAGIHAVRYLRRRHPPAEGVEYVDGGTLNFTLAETVGGAGQLIVIDAARLDAEPGTVRCLVNAEFDRYLAGPGRSAHEVGLSDLLDIARLTGDAPCHKVLIGIQPQSLGWGTRPTAPVEAALPEVARRVLALIGGRRPAVEPGRSAVEPTGAHHAG